MSSKKPLVLITGASGLLGRAILKTTRTKNWQTIGLAYSRCANDMVKCDLTNEDDIRKVFMNYKPDYIIHAAAERFPDKVESDFERALLMNSKSTEIIASIAKTLQSKLIYISTDYVFDGTSPPYYADSPTNPLNKYAKTKVAGEEVILNTYPEGSFILRVPVLYGPVEYLKESAVTCLFENLLDSKPVSVSHYEKRYPAHVDDIANIICDLLALPNLDELNGIYQWSGLEMMTKYDMIKCMAEVFSLDYSHVTPNSTKPSEGVSRPYDTHMDNSKLTNLNISHHSSFKDNMKIIFDPWMEKK